MCFRLSGTERETVGYNYRAAPGTAMTGNRANDTPVQPQSERINDFGAKPSQAMGTADREPAGGEIPVELVRCQPFDDFPQQPGCRGQIGLLENTGQTVKQSCFQECKYLPIP